MSRIGKLAINIPKDVEVNYSKSEVTVKGKFGTLQRNLPDGVHLTQDNNILKVNLTKKGKEANSFHGLYRTLINNMVLGVSEQFQIILLLKGVGYRANIEANEIVLNLGYSHPVKIKIPEKISVEVLQNTTIQLKSCDKELLGLFASNIRIWRKPEPYKGKGILYQNEQIIRKAGKSGK